MTDPVSFTAAAVITLLGSLLYSRRNNLLIRRVDSPKAAKPHKSRTLTGIVTSINDADGIRFYHTPTLRPFWRLRGSKNILRDTLSVRLAAIDAPEVNRGGTPQPYAIEAWKYLVRSLVPAAYDPSAKDIKRFRTLSSRPVRMTILGFDQYQRIIGMVRYRPFKLVPFYWRYISLDLVKEGLAEVYNQGNAQYGNMKDVFLYEQQKAKDKRKNMWSQKRYQSPKAFKDKKKGA